MALVLPLVAIMAFGILDLGRAYRLQTSLANAAHEGAAYAQFTPTLVHNVGTCADPNNIVYAARHEEGVTNSTFTITVQYTSQATDPATWTTITGCGSTIPTPAARVIVTAAADLKLLTPFVSAVFGERITLRESSEVVVQ